MSENYFYSFPGDARPTLAEVGGKGFSLIEASRASLSVPPGFVLSRHFFEPWFSLLEKTPEWKYFVEASETDLRQAADALKNAAIHFGFNDEQKRAIAQALEPSEARLFAVRSSSPHEDLEGASFAGGYETVLGVTMGGIEAAVHRCFQSCLDYRVFVYMRESGFNWSDPQIAVVVQTQIASDVAGVGFSIHPVTNNYDEVVFNANWGLGETVVAGAVTPDTFVVDTVSGAIVEKKIGSKESSVWLKKTGGTEEKKGFKSEECTLADAQIRELAELVKKVERHYGKPMDIEWAFAEGKLFLLQARPITAYVPLAPEMITEPGARKRLYFDLSITAEGMTRPISFLGTSSFHSVLRAAGKILFFRDINLDIDRAVAHASPGRLYVNVSTFLRLLGKERIVKLFSNIDPLAMKALEQLDETAYMPAISRLRLLPFGLLLRLPMILLYIAYAQHNPEWVHRHINKYISRFEQEATKLIRSDLPLRVISDSLTPKLFGWVFLRLIPLVIASRFALERLMRVTENDQGKDKLTRSLPHNVTIEMSLALSRLGKLVPLGISVEQLERQIKSNEAPQEFLAVWSRFMEKYGGRGPEEIDLASPRYRDNPKMLLELVLSLKNNSGETPEEAFERGVHERKATFASMHAKLLAKNSRQARQFENDYNTLVHFGGLRETHKYYLIYVGAQMRERILAIASRYVERGRLDTVEQIFDLSIEQVDAAQGNQSLDLRALARENTVFLKKLKRVARPPTLIDSRGFIPRPPAQSVREGEHAGVAISSGIVRGRVKVLHTPNEKPFLKGEILVARATDPGWTPLFINAAGVILEVGGVLQHGALVAREYGLPCVAGIDHATDLWKDGTLVEVDGSTGIVRIIELST